LDVIASCGNRVRTTPQPFPKIHKKLLAQPRFLGQYAPTTVEGRMFWSKPDKEKDRYYLLPGMGGAAARRKQHSFLVWSLIAGMLVAGALTLFLWFFNHTFVL